MSITKRHKPLQGKSQTNAVIIRLLGVKESEYPKYLTQGAMFEDV